MKDEWFRWEREATIHLLFPTLEGSMKHLEDYAGCGYPTTILIFKDGIVSWICREDDFYKVGEKLLAIYKDPNKEKEMVKDTLKRLAVLNKVEKEIEGSDLITLTQEKLINLYKRLHDGFVAYYSIGAMHEPIPMQAELELKSSTSLGDDLISSLTAPTKVSFIKEAENYLLHSKDIKGFIKKYYWIDNNYSGTKVLSEEDVKKRLNHLRINEKPHSLGNQAISLSKKGKRLIEILKNYGAYQDERKRNILIYLHFLEILLKEIGKRGNISLKAMRDSFPEEIPDILNGKISEDFINKRREKCFVVWEEGKDKPEILTGDQTKQWEEKLSVQRSNIQILKGNCASKGKAKGKVRVLLSASDNEKLEKGEILVTFMTSPDFMSAIRKCSAIVTNLGGVTSHAAIISRELGIPCVVGTKNATEALKTGDMVEVDANKGEIKILS